MVMNGLLLIFAALFAILAIDTEKPGSIDKLINVITGKNESEGTR